MAFDNTAKKRYREPIAKPKLRIASPKTIDSVLDSALGRYGIKEDLARYKFVLKWKEIVGDSIARFSKPECIRQGTLVVKVKDSAWAQELAFQKGIIIQRLNKHLDENLIDDVFFEVGEVES
ncbi:MAG: DUF721 domain-containing protein [Deltaproteobacteria bacterium]|nr:DUF721 domain-containing protein [Deltaproteobacteria bacterium]